MFLIMLRLNPSYAHETVRFHLQVMAQTLILLPCYLIDCAQVVTKSKDKLTHLVNVTLSPYYLPAQLGYQNFQDL